MQVSWTSHARLSVWGTLNGTNKINDKQISPSNIDQNERTFIIGYLATCCVLHNDLSWFCAWWLFVAMQSVIFSFDFGWWSKRHGVARREFMTPSTFKANEAIGVSNIVFGRGTRCEYGEWKQERKRARTEIIRKRKEQKRISNLEKRVEQDKNERTNERKRGKEKGQGRTRARIREQGGGTGGKGRKNWNGKISSRS